jgi:hypothetical protein
MTDTPAHLADDILNAWIDGAATPQEHQLVEHHMASCETCQRLMDELHAVKAMLATMPEVAPRRSFALTPEQAKKPTPIRERTTASNIIRLLPIVRTLSVAAMLAVLILGGSLLLNQDDSTVSPAVTNEMQSGETAAGSGSLGEANPAPASQERGEVVDQGEAASAHDSTSTTLAREGQAMPIATTDAGLTGLEIATIALGVASILLGVSWMWMSMAIRNGKSRT